MKSEICLEQVAKNLRKPLLDYCGELVKLHKDNLSSIVLYGACAQGIEFTRTSKFNLLLVFKVLQAETLKKNLKLIKKGYAKNILAPLCFTEEHILTSLDTFPMEFYEIKDANICVYGDDFFSDMQIDRENLRLECEQQAKALLIKVRQSYLEVGLARNGIENLILESLETVFPILRAVLRIKGDAVIYERSMLVEKIASIVGLQQEIFLKAIDATMNKQNRLEIKTLEFFNEYVCQLMKLAQYVDKM